MLSSEGTGIDLVLFVLWSAEHTLHANARAALCNVFDWFGRFQVHHLCPLKCPTAGFQFPELETEGPLEESVRQASNVVCSVCLSWGCAQHMLLCNNQSDDGKGYGGPVRAPLNLSAVELVVLASVWFYCY